LKFANLWAYFAFVFSSEELDFSVVQLNGELPIGATPVVKLRRSQISTIETGLTPDEIESWWIKHEIEPGAVGLLTIVGVDQDGFRRSLCQPGQPP